MTFLNPCIYDDGYRTIRRLLHDTRIGRALLRFVFGRIDHGSIKETKYNDHPETKKLIPHGSVVWIGTNVGIFNAYLVDIGTAATSTQRFNVYYVDGSGSFPVLMRAQYNLIDDSVVTAPQPIAAGVVALRVSYGVDPGSTGAVTGYEDGATVASNMDWGFVRSVRVALVTRTINDDPTSDGGGASAPTTIPIGATQGASFSAITVPSSKHRFITTTTEVAYRNWLWKN